MKKVVWEGDSLKVLKSFPENIKQNLGYNIHRLQNNQEPLDSKPVKSIGKGVFELRDKDAKTWYRVIYYVKIKDKVYVLHCFKKSSNKTPKKDLDLAKDRLKTLNEKLQREK